MGIGHFIKRASHKVKNKVKKVVNKATSETEKTFHKAEEEFKKTLKKTTNPVERLVKEAEYALEQGMNVEKLIKDGLKDLKNDVIKEVLKDLDNKIIEPVEDTVTKELPAFVKKELEEIVAALSKAVTKEGLKKTKDLVNESDKFLHKLSNSKPELIHEIDQLGFEIELGPLTLAYSGFYSRTEDLSEILNDLCKKPPKFSRKEIIKAVEMLGPDSVDFGLSIQVVALVIGSKELGAGVRLNNVSLALFTEIADLILEKIGVPE